MPIGPSVPPHLQAGPSIPPAYPTTAYPEEEDDDDANDFGPALPPHLAAARKAISVSGPSMKSPERVAAGPSLPGATVGPARPPPEYLEPESDDDEVGPKFVPGEAVEKSAVEEFMEREARWAREREVSSRASAISSLAEC